MAEDYVRPPIVAVEPPDPRLVKWRFRAVIALVLIALALIVFFIAHAIINSGNPSHVGASPVASARLLVGF
jgi:hypothetical protein